MSRQLNPGPQLLPKKQRSRQELGYEIKQKESLRLLTERIRTPGIRQYAQTSVSGDYTVKDSDYFIAVSGNVTVTLLSATQVPKQSFNIKNVGSGTVTVATTSSQTIDGAASDTLIQWESITVVSDGANWLVE